MAARLIYGGREYELPNSDFETLMKEFTRLITASPGRPALLPLDTDKGRAVFVFSAGVDAVLLDEERSADE